MLNLPRSTPEKHGIPSQNISRFFSDIAEKGLELHSFLLVKDGSVVAEGWWHPYGPELPHMLFSLSKSFTSTAVGFAAAEGLLTVDDPVISFFPEYVPNEPSANLTAMKVRHLLSMSTGHAADTTGSITSSKDGNWAKAFLSLPVEYEPGTHFLYNTGATYMLSAIIQRVTGSTLLHYLTPRLFKPLNIENPAWETCPMGINTGGFGLSVRTEDIAKFGQLYLQKGMWEGRQLLPAEWIEEATSLQVNNGDFGESDWAQGYGYQFWRCRHNAYRGDGAFGQYCIVMPEKNAVIAITSGIDNMQAVLDLIWQDLLPFMGKEPIIEKAGSYDELQNTLNSLKLLPPEGKNHSPVQDHVNGKRYVIESEIPDLHEIEFRFSDQMNRITLYPGQDGHPVNIDSGFGKWVENELSLERFSGKIMCAGAWSDENTYVAVMRCIETPFFYIYTCRFDGDELAVDVKVNVSFGPKEGPVLKGHLK